MPEIAENQQDDVVANFRSLISLWLICKLKMYVCICKKLKHYCYIEICINLLKLKKEHNKDLEATNLYEERKRMVGIFPPLFFYKK